jgi:hypothetical protein
MTIKRYDESTSLLVLLNSIPGYEINFRDDVDKCDSLSSRTILIINGVEIAPLGGST